jgi:hypothetical protein
LRVLPDGRFEHVAEPVELIPPFVVNLHGHHVLSGKSLRVPELARRAKGRPGSNRGPPCPKLLTSKK